MKLKLAIASMATLFLIILWIWWLIYGSDANDCRVKWSESGMEQKYQMWGGCKVSQDNGKTWIPADKWRKDL